MARLMPDEDRIDLPTVRAVQSTLGRLSATELAQEIDIPVARARVLPAGVAIVAALAERVRPARIEVSRDGIRTGLLREALSQRGDAPDPVDTVASGSDTRRDEPVPVPEASNHGTFRDAMQALIAARWREVWDAIPAALDGSDIEGVHDVRVASRRLRAAMDVAAPLFSQRWFRPVHRAAKEITSNLGEVRDRDVLLEALRADRDRAPLAEHPGIDRLIDRVERERAGARQEMEAYLRGLLGGSLRNETDRRFGSPAASPHVRAGDGRPGARR
jgi:hypothetical protein